MTFNEFKNTKNTIGENGWNAIQKNFLKNNSNNAQNSVMENDIDLLDWLRLQLNEDFLYNIG